MRIRKQIICVDEEGNPLGPPEDIPDPESVPCGLSALPGYISRLFASDAAFSSVLVSTSDGQGGFGLARRDLQTQLLLTVDWRRQPALERQLRDLLASWQLYPRHDYLAGNGAVADATRCLDYVLPESLETVTAICQDLLASCYGVSTDEALNFILR